MKLDFTRAQWLPESYPPPYDVILGVGADISFTSAGSRTLFNETLFPIVELALAASVWLATGFESEEDFSFDSVEFDEPGIIWIRYIGQRLWRIGSVYQNFEDSSRYSSPEVRLCLDEFVKKVDLWLRTSVGQRLSTIRLY